MQLASWISPDYFSDSADPFTYYATHLRMPDMNFLAQTPKYVRKDLVRQKSGADRFRDETKRLNVPALGSSGDKLSDLLVFKCLLF